MLYLSELYGRIGQILRDHGDMEVTENALHEFGIHMTDFNRGVSHYIRPMYDSERNRYFLLCSDSIPQTFDKKKLAKDQFDIEYE